MKNNLFTKMNLFMAFLLLFMVGPLNASVHKAEDVSSSVDIPFIESTLISPSVFTGNYANFIFSNEFELESVEKMTLETPSEIMAACSWTVEVSSNYGDSIYWSLSGHDGNLLDSDTNGMTGTFTEYGSDPVIFYISTAVPYFDNTATYTVSNGGQVVYSGSIGANQTAESEPLYCNEDEPEPEPSYCDVTPVTTFNGISNFATTDGYTNISNSSDVSYYSDYTEMAVSQSPENSFNFSISSNGSSLAMAIWVDWNQDYVFDSSENVYNSFSYLTVGTGTITIPAGTPEGDYRMRVVANWLSASQINPCGDLGGFGYGEAEDYTITVSGPPSCLTPKDLQVTGTTSTSADLSWSGDEANYEIEYGQTGFVQGSGTTVSANQNVTTLENLTEGEIYDAYVRSDCGEGDFSDWVGPVTFKVTDSVLYPGQINTDYGYPTVTTASNCAGTLTIQVPAGKKIATASTTYDMTGQNNAWVSEQASYLYSPTLGLGEATVTSGVGSFSGTYTYEERNLDFLTDATGDIEIELRAFRTWGGFACDDDYQFVNAGTWKINYTLEDLPVYECDVTASADTIFEEDCISEGEYYTASILIDGGLSGDTFSIALDDELITSSAISGVPFVVPEGWLEAGEDYCFDIYRNGDLECSAVACVESPVICAEEEPCNWRIRVWSANNGAGVTWYLKDGKGNILDSGENMPASYNYVSPVYSAAGPVTFHLDGNDPDNPGDYRSVNYYVLRDGAKIYHGRARNNIIHIEDIYCNDNDLRSVGGHPQMDLSEFEFSFYPNPVKDILNISSEKKVKSIQIFNISGQLVKYINGNNPSSNKIEVTELPAGTYLIKAVLEGGQIETFKIIKK